MKARWLALAALLALPAWSLLGISGADGAATVAPPAWLGASATAQPAGAPPLQLTPLGMRVLNAPVPVKGSDGRMHLVYELELSNFTGASLGINGLDVIDAASGKLLASLQPADIANRLVLRDKSAVAGSIGPSQLGLLYLHLSIADPSAVPAALAHRASVVMNGNTISETAGRIAVAPATKLVVGAPLHGPNFIAGDGCCDSTRHVRATLPLNGQLFTAQRFAIDWEEIDDQGRIYVGDPKLPKSYLIYGKPIHAVADGTVVAALDGLPDSPPGALPASLPIEQADGNHVVVDLGGGNFALFAHMAPGSVRVHVGERVREGDVLGLVGTSGNSSEPHLHFHIVDGPSPLASNGLPYLMRSFSASRRGVSTAAYDQASGSGVPLATQPVAQPGPRENVMPLDLWIVDLPS